MAKTIVNIITEDNPIPAYLFIKEMYQEGDKLMYISAKDTEDDLDLLAEIDGVESSIIDEIVLKHDMDEFTYEKICRTIKPHLAKGIEYCVNLAGGTRYMALAVQQVFEDFKSTFYYTDIENNIIIKSKFDDNIYDNDDRHFPIKYRMSLNEYLKAHEMKNDLFKDHSPHKSEEEVNSMYDLFSQELLTCRDFNNLETLRNFYRNQKRTFSFSEIKNPTDDKIEAIPDIEKFLVRLNFKPEIDNHLTHDDVTFLTGGWFEEYVYYLMKKNMNPQDISLNVVIHPQNVNRINELDVIFMKGNKLFVIECKSGVENQRMFNEIVYKACALKESLLGVSCQSYIISLKKDTKDKSLKRIANNMDIKFVDYYNLTDKNAMTLVFSEMNLLANDNNVQ